MNGLMAYLIAKLKKKADLVGGKVPADQLPSYVDDVVEYPSFDDFPATGEAGKIYVALDTNKTYRWSGSTYIQIGGGNKPYLSLERKSRYLYDVSFLSAPPDTGVDSLPGNCSSYVQDGKLYRNLDWNYDDTATFHVHLPNMEGLAFINGLSDSNIDDDLISQLPYHMVDGVNEHGIMVSTHVLYNDWEAVGTGEIPLTYLPYIALTRVKSMATIEDDLDGVLDNLKSTPALIESGYLIQVLVTDGTTTYVLRPYNAADGTYEAVDITENPKLSNFRWVQDETVVRSDLQNRPTGVERWNMMPCPLEDLRFTKAYESPDRLSEFIGIDGTTKDSTDEELTAIYNLAHAAYLDRERDGETWQTMHSVVYSPSGMEHLYIQEDCEKDYISSGGVSPEEFGQRTVTIAVADWNGGTTVTKTVPGVTATNSVIVDPSDASVEATAQAADSLTFSAEDTPTEDVTVKVVILP